jgi:hypothetical protein
MSRKPIDQLAGLGSLPRKSEHHHGSHRDLLRPVRVSAPTDGWVDVVVVPSSRPVGYLREAVRLARNLGCVLVVLASGRCGASEVLRRYGVDLPGRLLAIDIPTNYRAPGGLLRFDADALVAEVLPRRSDISVKRNVALLLARAVGVRRLLFLDDDIIVPDWVDVLRAASALSRRHHAVGMYIDGFPDNSVVCHAHRLTGGAQETFVGGGALMLNPQRVTGYFPNVYNEDWFFLLERAANRSVATTGVTVQRPYDPFATVARAEGEEFGDVLAEGLFWRLDEGRTVEEADASFWEGALARRARFIAEIVDRQRAAPLPPEGRSRMVAALDAAERVRRGLPAQACAQYVQAWTRDRATWARRLEDWRTGPELAKVIAELGLASHRFGELTTALTGGLHAGLRPVPEPLADQHGSPLWLPATPMLLATARRTAPSVRPVRDEAPVTIPARLSPDSTIGVGEYEAERVG